MRYKENYTLYKRGEVWYYRTYTPDGKRTAGKSTGCTSKTLADKYCAQLFKNGQLVNHTSLTFGQFAAHFYDDDSNYCRDRSEPLSFNTLRGYRIKMNQYLLPYFGNTQLSDITYTMLKQFRIKMLSKYSVSNTISTMSCLKIIIQTAYRDRLIIENPFFYLEPLHEKKNSRDAFSLEEVQELYRLIPDEFKKTILLMALTGMRISEAVGIRSSDFVDTPEYSYIHLTEQYSLKKYRPLKSGYYRDIPIIPEIKELIGFQDTRLPAFYRYYNQQKKYFENAEERNLSFHSLRHFFITNTKSSGVNDVKVEVIAGHSLKGITKVYTNFKVNDLLDILPWQKKTLELIKKGAEPANSTPQD